MNQKPNIRRCHLRKTSHLKRKINSSHIHRTEIFQRFCWCFAHFSPLQFPLNDIHSDQLNVKYFLLLIYKYVSSIASPGICILSNALFSRIHVHFRFRRIWSSSLLFSSLLTVHFIVLTVVPWQTSSTQIVAFHLLIL